MSRLMQFLIRAYLPLAARHALLDGPLHATRRPKSAPSAGSDTTLARIAPNPQRPPARSDGQRVASLAA